MIALLVDSFFLFFVLETSLQFLHGQVLKDIALGWCHITCNYGAFVISIENRIM